MGRNEDGTNETDNIARRRGWIRRNRDAPRGDRRTACTRILPTMRSQRRAFQATLQEPNGRSDGRAIARTDRDARERFEPVAFGSRGLRFVVPARMEGVVSIPMRRNDPSWHRHPHTHQTSLPPVPPPCPRATPHHSFPSDSIPNHSQRFTTIHNGSQREGKGTPPPVGCICDRGCICSFVDRVWWEELGEGKRGATSSTGV